MWAVMIQNTSTKRGFCWCLMPWKEKSYQLLIDVWLQLHQVMDSSVNHEARLVVNSHSMWIQILLYSLAALVTTLKGGGVSWFHHVHPSVDKVKFLYSSIDTIIWSTMITFNTYNMYVALDPRRITIIVFHAQGQTWAIIQMYNSSDFSVHTFILQTWSLTKSFQFGSMIWWLILTLTYDLVQVFLVQWPHFL